MQDMTADGVNEIRVHSRRIGTAVAYALLIFSVYILVMGFINNPMDSYGVTFLMCMILVVPAVLFADYFSRQILVTNDGLTRIGLFGRKTMLPWEKVKKIQLIRNNAGMRELVVIGRRKKFVLSNTIFLLSKPNFWDAAFVILDRANEAGWPVRTGLLGREAWFFHGFEYLPGKDFEDRKSRLNGPEAK